MTIDAIHYTDPASPFACSAEPVRWHYGDQLAWRTRMIVLTLEPGEAERLAAGAPGLQRRFGMPIDPAPYPRASASEPACRAVVAALLGCDSQRVSTKLGKVARPTTAGSDFSWTLD